MVLIQILNSGRLPIFCLALKFTIGIYMYQYVLNICTHEERDPKLNILPLESTSLTTAQVILFPGVRPWEQPQAFIGDEKKPLQSPIKMHYFGLNLDVYYSLTICSLGVNPEFSL